MAAAVMLLLVLPFCASGEATIPDVEIVALRGGETFEEYTRLGVVADGFDLRDPYVYTSNDNTGEALRGCVFYSTASEAVSGELNMSVHYDYPRNPMKCSTALDMSAFSEKGKARCQRF